MARISLRAYNAEIEALIESEKTDEAVAHCRHILAIFPKHVHTYRLLGKAYLENRQHTEALDIFERLLTAMPDDFIAHLGMSIIREEEGNLDAAIWHMERAFEIQPYNSAIQDEMRRLYGRRDGAEPVKIRLTRGALARMYARGNLYEQAIAEIRQVLANEPQRPDMQVLLAQMYEKMEKPVQAAEVCSRLLKKYPYCLEANRILAHVLENSKRPEEAKAYRERLQALDPYYAYINPQAPTLADIPDEAVQLEKMAHTSADLLPVQQESGWLTTIGVEETALEAVQEEEELPDWLTGEEEPQEAAATPDSLTEASASEEEPIPDWMKAAGWGPDSGEFDESAVSLENPEEAPVEAGEEDAAPAELPDWLQEIAPPEVATGMLTMPEEEMGEEEDQALAALIDTGSLGPLPEQEESTAQEMPDWLTEMAAEETTDVGQPTTEEAAPAEEIPEWLEEATVDRGPETVETPSTVHRPPSEEEPAAPSSAEDMDAAMAWLEGLAAKQGVSEEELLTAPEERPEEAPEWVAEMAEETTDVGQPTTEEAAPAEEIPEWLEEATVDRGPETVETPSTVHRPPSEEEIPEWLAEETVDRGPETVGTPSTVDRPPSEEEIPEWLAEATVDRGPESVETPSTVDRLPSEEEIPDWLTEMAEETTDVGQPTAEEAAPAEEIPEWLTEMAEETTDVGQPTTEEAAPAEEIPEWLAKATVDRGPESVETPSTVDRLPSEEEIPEWLEEATGDRGPETVETPSTVHRPPSEEEPAEPSSVVPGPSSAEDMDAAMAWLEGLAAKQGVSEEELLTTPEERPEEAPEWVAEIAEETTEVGQPAAEEAAPAEEIPDWLTEMAAEETTDVGQPTTEEAAPAEEIPEWLEEATVDRGPETVETPSTVHRPPSEEEPAEPSSVVPGPSSAEASSEEETEPLPPQEVPVATGPLPPPPEWVLEGEAPEEEAAAPITWDESGQADIEKLELNQASLVQLERLPGIGFRLAQAITTYREAHGPFRSLQDLENVAGIGPMTISELQNFLYVEAPKAAKRRRSPTGMPLPDAEAALREGDAEEAVRILAPVIHSGGALDEVIHMLKQSLRDVPDNLDLWIALGDACMRADRLEEALEAYNRAEEILASGI